MADAGQVGLYIGQGPLAQAPHTGDVVITKANAQFWQAGTFVYKGS